MFLSQKEKYILSILPSKATNYNLSKEYFTMLNLKIVMKKLRTKLKIQVELMDKRNKLFPNLRMKNVITENENNYLGSILKKQPL